LVVNVAKSEALLVFTVPSLFASERRIVNSTSKACPTDVTSVRQAAKARKIVDLRMLIPLQPQKTHCRLAPEQCVIGLIF